MPGIYNISHYRGDTLKSFIFKFVKNGSNINLTNKTFLIQFRKGSKFSDVALQWTLGNGCHVSTPASGELVIDGQIVNLDEGVYFYDIQMTDTITGDVDTYIEGTLTITQDTSR